MRDETFDPANMRYIKLGPGNAWWKHARENNLLELDHRAVPDDVARSGRFEEIRALVAAYNPGKAASFTNEILSFYHLPAGTVWITFAGKRMWWAKAGTEITWLGESAEHGVRARSLEMPWRSTDFNGGELRIEELPGSLRRTAGYPQSICRVAAAEIAIQRILGQNSEVALEARRIKQEMVAIAERMVKRLQAEDFEILIDLTLAASGWRRVDGIGGLQRDTDLVLRQSLTHELGFVQIKSSADASTFRDYVERFRESGQDRMFFACHSPVGDWGKAPENVLILTGAMLAERVIDAGQFDWLLAKTR